MLTGKDPSYALGGSFPIGSRAAMDNPWAWVGRHDRDYAALRRAGRAAIVMPALFAVGSKVIKNADVATFAAFGSFAMLLLVGFTGPMRERLQAQAALALTGAVFVAIGTLASGYVWLAAAAMSVVGFAVLFAGVVSSVLAGATTSLLLAFILPVTLTGPVSAIPDRLLGWTLASVASLIAIAVLWPMPTREPLRVAAATACRALGTRLRSEIAFMMSGYDDLFAADHEHTIQESDEAVAALHRIFLATPYRPTGLSTVNRTIVRLVDELIWLKTIIVQSGRHRWSTTDKPVVDQPVRDVKLAACAVLERAADLLERTAGDTADLQAAMAELASTLTAMEQNATNELPVHRRHSSPDEFITSLDPGFRSQELSFAVSQIARNVDLAAAAERRTWV